MSSFKAALAAYKKTTAEVVPVNPPEAVAVMEEKTVPEVETIVVATDNTVTLTGFAAPKAEEGPKKRAPRGSSKKSAEPTESTDTASEKEPAREEPTRVRSSSPEGYAEGNSLADAILLVQSLLPVGSSITINKF
jgi:hypothetical protein